MFDFLLSTLLRISLDIHRHQAQHSTCVILELMLSSSEKVAPSPRHKEDQQD